MRAAMGTEPGTSGANEDWCAATPAFALVLDGVTPGEVTGCLHGVPWYVRHLGSYLVLHLAEDVSVTDALANAIRDVAALHQHTCDLSNPGTPAATVALLREYQHHIQYLVLADSVLVLDTEDGTEVVTDSRVDEVATVEREGTTRYLVGTPEHQQSVERLMAAQLYARNRPGGYWVAAADPSAALEARTGTVQRRNLRRAAILSDGASRLVDQYRLTTWLGLLDILSSGGPGALINRVREADNMDPSGQNWARYKRSDDATAVYVWFSDTGEVR